MKSLWDFNTTATHFEPTEVYWIPARSIPLEALQNSPYAPLLNSNKLLESVLGFNRLHPGFLKTATARPIPLLLNHPKMYQREFQAHPGFAAHRNRSFSLLTFALGQLKIESLLASALQSPTPKFLDIGCGTGRALLELQAAYPAARAEGVCLPGEAPTSLAEIAEFFGLPLNPETPPRILEADLNSLPLLKVTDGKFDLILSQGSFRFIQDKLSLLEQAWETLRPGGVALIELQGLKLQDSKGRPIAIETFIHASTDEETANYFPGFSLLVLKKTRELPLGLRGTLLKEKSRHTPAHPDPSQNRNVGWTSVYIIESANPSVGP